MTPRSPRYRRHLLRLAPSALCTALALLLLPATPLWAQDSVASARRSGGLKASTPVTLNFVNADIDAVSRAMAAMTNRQILVDPREIGRASCRERV